MESNFSIRQILMKRMSTEEVEKRLESKAQLIKELSSFKYYPEDEFKYCILRLFENLDETADPDHNVSLLLEELRPYLTEHYQKLLSRSIELKQKK